VTLSSNNGPARVVWLNGRFLPLHQAAVSPMDRGFLYGDGVFETMRAQEGIVLYLEDHLERLHRSLEELRIPVDLSLDWKRILIELLERNALLNTIAVVKIVVSRGTCPGPGLPSPELPTICVSAQEYHLPDEAIYRNGWRLKVFTEGFSPPLARHKTLNYLYFCMARQSALDAGADEALVLDPSGSITETSAGSLLARTQGKWWTPASPYQLSGTTLRQLSTLLHNEGNPVEVRQASLEDLFSAQTIWILNSLMLIMPVFMAEGRPVPDCGAEEASRLRRELVACRLHLDYPVI